MKGISKFWRVEMTVDMEYVEGEEADEVARAITARLYEIDFDAFEVHKVHCTLVDVPCISEESGSGEATFQVCKD